MLPTDPAHRARRTDRSSGRRPIQRAPVGRSARPADGLPPAADSRPSQAPPVAAAGAVRSSPLAIVVVAVLAGGALFMSGCARRPADRRAAGHADEPRRRVPAVLGHLRGDRGPLRRRRRRPGGAHRRRDPGHGRGARGPVLRLPDARGVPVRACRTCPASSRGSAPRSARGRRPARRSDCATLGPDCILIVVAPLEGSPAEKAGLQAGDAILAGRRRRARRPDGRRGPRQGPRQEGHDGRPDDPARDRTTRSTSRSSATSSSSERSSSRTSPTATIGYIDVTGFSDNAASQFHDALQADLDAGRKKIILDLRGNPGGYVTAARQIASEFIGDGPLFWEEDADGPAGRRPTPRRAALATSDDVQRRRPRRPRHRLGQRDRRGRAPGPGPGDARRRDDVRQGHRPAVDRAPGQRRAQADDRQVADARQALDPPGRDRAGRRRGDAGAARARTRIPALDKAVETLETTGAVGRAA